MTVLMWEAQAAPGRLDDLRAHAAASADPAAEIYLSADDRVVVIDPSGRGVGEVPAELVSRAPQQWSFERVPR